MELWRGQVNLSIECQRQNLQARQKTPVHQRAGACLPSIGKHLQLLKWQ